ncbi:post-GPI attachment to proteins factor 3 [Nematocida ausubeli]|nr:post-GPI attachment to proteins factor 3 [Nematocida ausubeli]
MKEEQTNTGPYHVYGILSARIDAFLFSHHDFQKNQKFIKECIKQRNTSVKYLGKYAFIRVCHAQEAVSSVFSFLSAISAGVSLIYILRMIKRQATKAYPHPAHLQYLATLKYTFCVHVATWIFSGIFHIRDTYSTQCMDYFGAIASISSTLVLSGNKLSIYPVAIRRILMLFGTVHVLYMHFVEFNFLYNSIVCGVLFGCNFALWSVWHKRASAHSYSKILKLSMLGILVSAAFQVIDFGPVYFLLDSHALWHILGWLFSTSLYVFLIVDAESMCSSKLHKIKQSSGLLGTNDRINARQTDTI